MSSTYLDIFQYLRKPSGLITSGYYGNAFRFATTQAAGASSLAIPASAITEAMNAYDNLYIFDGLNSEVVQVASTVSPSVTSVSLVNPTVYQHKAGIVACSDGTSTISLAEQIFIASQWVEDICHQSLWVSTYSNEVLTMPTMRASVNNEGVLWFRPRHFPITDLTAISIKADPLSVVQYDPTQAIIDSEQQLISIRNLVPLSNTPGNSQVTSNSPWNARSRNRQQWLTITYDSGWTNLPSTIVRACSLLVNQCFVQTANSLGADSIVEGERNVVFTMRGDTSGESLLVKEAQRLLQPYVMEAN